LGELVGQAPHKKIYPSSNERRKYEIYTLAPSKILDKKKLEMRVCSVFLNKLSFDSKNTLDYCIKLRKD
jgi:hypothetical protein